MAVKRMKNWLGQQRVDVPHLREIESAVAADFDDLAGKILASSRAIVVHGMTIAMGAAVGNAATQLVLNTANAILLHGTASEPGALFVVPGTQPAETLGTSNPVVVGSFTPNAINYIGIDLIRLTDATTDDTVKFRSATTKKEFSQQVPLARTLQYRVIISPQDFTQLPSVAPVAKVLLDASGLVVSVTDSREMMFRLGSGGSVPDPLAIFAWPGGRIENPVTSTTTSDPFTGADKSIASFIDFFHAMESRLWEVGGGEHWYSQTTDRDVFFVRDPANVFISDDENFEWTGTNLHWKGISFDFGNSTAVKNTIAARLTDSPGLTDLAVGQCIYVDVDRAVDNAILVVVKANLSSLGTPTIPGSRHIIAWRVSEGVFGLGQAKPVGFAFAHATDLAYGVVKLYASAGTDAIVPAVDAGGLIVARGMKRDTAGVALLFDESAFLATALSALPGLTATGDGVAAGISGTGGGTSGIGVVGTGGAPNGRGMVAQATGNANGIDAITGASDGGYCVNADGSIAAATNTNGVFAKAKGTGIAVTAQSGTGAGAYAVYAVGEGTIEHTLVATSQAGAGNSAKAAIYGHATQYGPGGKFESANDAALNLVPKSSGTPTNLNEGDIWLNSLASLVHNQLQTYVDGGLRDITWRQQFFQNDDSVSTNPGFYNISFQVSASTAYEFEAYLVLTPAGGGGVDFHIGWYDGSSVFVAPTVAAIVHTGWSTLDSGHELVSTGITTGFMADVLFQYANAPTAPNIYRWKGSFITGAGAASMKLGFMPHVNGQTVTLHKGSWFKIRQVKMT